MEVSPSLFPTLSCDLFRISYISSAETAETRGTRPAACNMADEIRPDLNVKTVAAATNLPIHDSTYARLRQEYLQVSPSLSQTATWFLLFMVHRDTVTDERSYIKIAQNDIPP
jgi:hypothetical protein